MGTMMALRAHARGGPEQLVYEQAPVPSAGPGEVLVAVHAAAITFAELTWDLEWTTRDGKDRTPVIPSHEMSGVVAGLGAGVAGPAAGELARLAELAGTGRLRAVISQTFPLAKGRQAFQSGAAARPPGKTVLIVR
jgi:NADPH:quinone reductase-like Zn-dependent oxidoreductase